MRNSQTDDKSSLKSTNQASLSTLPASAQKVVLSLMRSTNLIFGEVAFFREKLNIIF